VVDHELGTLFAVVVKMATKEPYPELKNSSGKHPVTLPMIPSNRSLIYPIYPLPTLGL
jgi:hypothetical protein